MKGHTYVSSPVDKDGYVNWTEAENATWKTLITRQNDIVKNRACDEYLEGLRILDFPMDRVPQIPEINAKLADCTGWGVEPVPAIIQPKEFFSLLARKRFPAATFIRIPEEIDYIQEPDIFHEIYGHCPLLTMPEYANFMQAFGELALKAEPKDRRRLFRLFWFTIEFGLIKTDKGLRAYGGGILSSIGETQYCLTDACETQDFNTLEALRTPYRIDIMQPLYFVIHSCEQLFEIMQEDILATLQKAKELGDYPPKYPPKEEEPIEDNDEKGAMRC